MAWIEVMPGVYAGVRTRFRPRPTLRRPVTSAPAIRAAGRLVGRRNAGARCQRAGLRAQSLYTVSESHTLNPSCKPSWRHSGRPPKRPARPANTSTVSWLSPVMSRTPPDNCALAAKTPIQHPARPTSAAYPAFGVPDTAEIKTYVAPKAWHVWEFTWEQRPSPSLTLGGL